MIHFFYIWSWWVLWYCYWTWGNMAKKLWCNQESLQEILTKLSFLLWLFIITTYSSVPSTPTVSQMIHSFWIASEKKIFSVSITSRHLAKPIISQCCYRIFLCSTLFILLGYTYVDSQRDISWLDESRFIWCYHHYTFLLIFPHWNSCVGFIFISVNSILSFLKYSIQSLSFVHSIFKLLGIHSCAHPSHSCNVHRYNVSVVGHPHFLLKCKCHVW